MSQQPLPKGHLTVEMEELGGAINSVAKRVRASARSSTLRLLRRDTSAERKESQGDGDAIPLGGVAVVVDAPLEGLSTSRVLELRKIYGFNEIVTAEDPAWKQVLRRYFGFVPVLIIIAAIVSISVPVDGTRDYFSFALLIVQCNLVVWADYLSARHAGDAVKELKALSAPVCTVRRDNKWEKLSVRELVPGDRIALVIGDVAPADARLCVAPVGVDFDESSLTGEAFAVSKFVGDEVLAGASVKRGEGEATVLRTGPNTLFGKTIMLTAQVSNQPQLMVVLRKLFYVIACVGFVACLCLFLLMVFSEDIGPAEGIKISIALLIAVVPTAMSVVVSATLAAGSRELSRRKVVVTRLAAIQELAGMDTLCSDKTGTLTLNKLSTDEPWLAPGHSQADMLLYALLCSHRAEEGRDAIDAAIFAAAPEDVKKDAQSYEVLEFVPFDPTRKRTEAAVRAPDGRLLRVAKGAPQIIRKMCDMDDESAAMFDEAVVSMASRGQRALAVAVQRAPDRAFELAGLVSIFDPPRADTKETIEEAGDFGVHVKMITGDHRAIAVEMARRLGMGTNIVDATALDTHDQSLSAVIPRVDDVVENCNGVAGCLPQHKYAIVEALQRKGYFVGMTGDGVNDAPALRKANIGIAVHGATDAAKAAADIVLLEPGLGAIIAAIKQSRIIFRRLQSYIAYRVASSVIILLWFFLSSVALGFLMPMWVLVLLSLINDFTIISTAKDYVVHSQSPVRWNPWSVLTVGVQVGVCSAAATFLLLYLSSPHYASWWHLFDLDEITDPELVAVLFLGLSIAIQLNLFSARTHGFFFSRRPSWYVGTVIALGLLVSTLIAVYWPNSVSLGGGSRMSSVSWGHVGVTWAYVVLWFVVTDVVKAGLFYVVHSDVNAGTLLVERARANARASSIRALHIFSPLVRRIPALVHSSRQTKADALERRVAELEREMREVRQALALLDGRPSGCATVSLPTERAM